MKQAQRLKNFHIVGISGSIENYERMFPAQAALAAGNILFSSTDLGAPVVIAEASGAGVIPLQPLQPGGNVMLACHVTPGSGTVSVRIRSTQE